MAPASGRARHRIRNLDLAQARDGYYVDQEFRIDIRPAAATADPDSKPILRSFNMRPLLDPPPGKDKLDQLLDWLKEQEPRLQP